MKRMVLGLLAILGMASISSPGFGADDEGVDPRIGEEVNRICFMPSINGWRTVDRLDDVVLLQRGVNDWYYVELLGACSNNVLRSAIQIAIESRPGAGCITRGDQIIVRDTPGLSRRCHVQRMYEWDDDASAPDTESDESD